MRRETDQAAKVIDLEDLPNSRDAHRFVDADHVAIHGVGRFRTDWLSDNGRR